MSTANEQIREGLKDPWMTLLWWCAGPVAGLATVFFVMDWADLMDNALELATLCGVIAGAAQLVRSVRMLVVMAPSEDLSEHPLLDRALMEAAAGLAMLGVAAQFAGPSLVGSALMLLGTAGLFWLMPRFKARSRALFDS